MRWCRCLKYFLMEEKDSSFLHNQYHGSWWPGDPRTRGARASAAMVLIWFSWNILVSASQVPYIYASMHCVSIGSDNGLSPVRRQAIIWTNSGLLSIEPLGTIFSEILFEIQNFSFMKMHLKISAVKWRPFCPEGDELMAYPELCHSVRCLHAMFTDGIQLHGKGFTLEFSESG